LAQGAAAARTSIDSSISIDLFREQVDKFLDKQCLMQDPQFGKDMISLKSDSYDLEGREFEKLHNFKECGRSRMAAWPGTGP